MQYWGILCGIHHNSPLFQRENGYIPASKHAVATPKRICLPTTGRYLKSGIPTIIQLVGKNSSITATWGLNKISVTNIRRFRRRWWSRYPPNGLQCHAQVSIIIVIGIGNSTMISKMLRSSIRKMAASADRVLKNLDPKKYEQRSLFWSCKSNRQSMVY